METTTLGDTDLTISRMGLGCMGMSEFYGEIDEDEAAATLERALELGVTFLDTSDVYGPDGANERFVGRLIREHRREVVLATKFGIRRSATELLGICGRPEYVREACDASLGRLGVDEIDLYYQHRVDPAVPIEDTVGAMSELVEQGKVRYLGLSEATPEQIRRAVKVHPIAALQTEYSLWSRDPEDELLALCRELKIGFVAYSPLGRGFITGAIKSVDDLDEDDWRRNNPRFQGDNFILNLELVKRVDEIAQDNGCEPAQLALAWVMARDGNVVPIPGTKRRKYLEQNLGALDIALNQEELERLDKACPQGAAHGDRYTIRT